MRGHGSPVLLSPAASDRETKCSEIWGMEEIHCGNGQGAGLDAEKHGKEPAQLS